MSSNSQALLHSTCLEDVPSWAEQHLKNKITLGYRINQLDCRSEINMRFCEKIGVWRGDITKLKVDAVVNSTTGGYCGEFGVDAAIHSAAGHELRNECSALRSCKTGEAKITRGYKLAAKYIIHTVGPVDDDVVNLKSCYENSLALMLSHNLRTIAFPCISTGERGFPEEQAANVAIMTVRGFLEKNYRNVNKIIFCTYLPKDKEIYERLLYEYFPVRLQ